MENFFIDDHFCSGLEDLMDHLDLYNDEDILNLEDDWSVKCYESSLQPVVNFSLDWIMDRINEERFDEDGHPYDKVVKVFKDNIDFEKINSQMPKLYYGNNKSFLVTKQDLLEFIQPDKITN